jgi:hypothetical protein
MITGQNKDKKNIIADPLDPTHDRNEFRLGFTPQAEIWNGRLANDRLRRLPTLGSCRLQRRSRRAQHCWSLNELSSKGASCL